MKLGVANYWSSSVHFVVDSASPAAAAGGWESTELYWQISVAPRLLRTTGMGVTAAFHLIHSFTHSSMLGILESRIFGVPGVPRPPELSTLPGRSCGG